MKAQNSGTGRDPITNCKKRNYILFEDTKKKPNNLETLYHTSLTFNPAPVEPERAFTAMGLFVKNSEE